ncbi:hypothetical protein [Winogradskyella jejuensis]|uniref:hypothetical protein n=1 Tax=Winogradskyella jejuensis TaxID=1089305 RepID=UPI00116134A5|nr:hypothetical protein [Winogradskyella jejuensis]
MIYPIISSGQSKVKHIQQIFVPHSYYKEYYTKTDSLGYKIKDKDTLIHVSSFIKPKGVGVPYEFKDDTFLEVYKPIAFQSTEKKNSDSEPMKYWKEEIKIYFTPNISKRVKKEFLRFTKTIDKNVDSLKVRNVKNIENANYIIYTNNDFEYEENLKSMSSGGYYINWNRKNQIIKGHIKLNTKNLFSDLVQIQKAKELFILSLGWFKPSNTLDCTSYFSNCFSDKKVMSSLDWEILKYHYSYGICKGTKISQFEEQHKRGKKSMKNPHNKFVIYHHY